MQNYPNKETQPVVSYAFADFLGDGRRDLHTFMSLGPFVLQTDAVPETEFLYERERILAWDYLTESGGEQALAPYFGQGLPNRYFDEPVSYWTTFGGEYTELRYRTDNNQLEFERAIYMTPQRSCVYYLAAYIDCEQPQRAILHYDNSGCYVFLNGELIQKRVQGRQKGLQTMGGAVAITLREGRNLLVFKMRTGYICDSIDFCMPYCTLQPVALSAGALGVIDPGKTTVYCGEKEAPREVFPGFVGAFDSHAGGELAYESGGFRDTLSIPAMQAGECHLVRYEVPVGDEKADAALHLTLTEGETQSGTLTVQTIPWDGFVGREHLFSDFHFDTTYHQEQRVYALGAIHITMDMLCQLRKNPDFKATLSEVDYLHPYYSLFPGDRALLREAFRTGRAQADCFYNQPNDLTSSGEGFVRNLVYGQLYHRDVLGGISKVYSPGDVFGHPNQMSQICKKGGCTSAEWGKHIVGVDQLFHHMSPDGTEILHSKGIGKDTALRLQLQDCHNSSTIENKTPAYSNEGDSSWMKKTLNGGRFSKTADMMQGIIETDAAQAAAGEAQAELCARDLTPHHAGVLLTRTDFKQANRLAENLLITAEKFASIAAYYGADYPEKALDKAWRQVLCAQHHDSITGTNNEISFVDLMIEYREAVELAGDVADRAVAYLASGVQFEEGEGYPVVVFNPHPFARKDACSIRLPSFAAAGSWAMVDDKGDTFTVDILGQNDDKTVNAVFVPEVPPLGYATYYLREAAAPKAAEAPAEPMSIENEVYRLTVDPALGGGIVSLFDKRQNKEVLSLGADGPANRVVVLREVPDRIETQHEIYTTGHKLFSSDYKAQVTRETGANYQKLTVCVQLDIVAKVRQEITLFAGSERIEMQTQVEDYQHKDDLFTLTFPLNLKGAKPVYDDRFAPHIVGRGEKKLSFQTHQSIMYSHTQIAPANQWIDLGPTVQLAFTDEEEIPQGMLNIGMTAIVRRNVPQMRRSADRLLTVLAKKAVPVTLYSDLEEHKGGKMIHFNEDLRNTDTRFVLSVQGVSNVYEDTLLQAVPAETRLAFQQRLAAQDVAVLFMRDSDNVWGKPIDVLLVKAASVQALDAWIAALAAQFAQGSRATLCALAAATPGEVEDYGVALLNAGTIACSVETGNLLNMMLFHTAAFYGNEGKTTGGDQLVPEHKTHCFTYALYPHTGSFREAGVYQQGLAFNDPLLAVEPGTPLKKAALPPRKSFVRCENAFVLTAFKAGGYPMANMRDANLPLEQRGFVLRGFEPFGVDGRVQFQFGFPLESVHAVNLLEEEPVPVASEKHGFTTEIGAHSIETYAIGIPAGKTVLGAAQIGAVREVVEPTFIRTWDHDLGSMPMGYLRTAAFISRKLAYADEKTIQTTVSVVNNCTDAPVSGTLRLTCTDALTISDNAFSYTLEPNAAAEFPLTITKAQADTRGMVHLTFAADGQTFCDVLELGIFEPSLEMQITQDAVLVTITNATGEALFGELALATPIETWGGRHNAFAYAEIGPRTMAASLPAGERTTFTFPLRYTNKTPFAAFYAVAKLMVNGRIYFAYAHQKGSRHHHKTNEMRKQIARDNGSYMRVLRM